MTADAAGPTRARTSRQPTHPTDPARTATAPPTSPVTHIIGPSGAAAGATALPPDVAEVLP